ncbi:hypothetical protein [Fuscovulum ytuae]|uniref:Uncharacterized protein n=1 Tax=Fuscovulum ytuae TaxID=3042299 RepID=A0ABY8Q5S0_9RHOB|nr:hypothetical protein [Fuscovulum sp. YMD61]WGV15527.1 hypothetical protein QF092_14845 [Fuscovulum sp. YMD61]
MAEFESVAAAIGKLAIVPKDRQAYAASSAIKVTPSAVTAGTTHSASIMTRPRPVPAPAPVPERADPAAFAPSEIEAATDIPAPEGTEEMILVSFDGAYIQSRLTGDEVDTLMGGDGICELELFDEIVPRNGTWAPAIIARQDSGGPEGLGALLDPLLSNAAGPPAPFAGPAALIPRK